MNYVLLHPLKEYCLSSSSVMGLSSSLEQYWGVGGKLCPRGAYILVIEMRN